MTDASSLPNPPLVHTYNPFPMYSNLPRVYTHPEHPECEDGGRPLPFRYEAGGFLIEYEPERGRPRREVRNVFRIGVDWRGLVCGRCASPATPVVCERCMTMHYCSEVCVRRDLVDGTHKYVCGTLLQIRIMADYHTRDGRERKRREPLRPQPALPRMRVPGLCIGEYVRRQRQDPDRVSLIDIPAGVLGLVMGYLDTASVFMCRYTCRTLAEVGGRYLPLIPIPSGDTLQKRLSRISSPAHQRAIRERAGIRSAVLAAVRGGYMDVLLFLLGRKSRGSTPRASSGGGLLSQIWVLVGDEGEHRTISTAIREHNVELAIAFMEEIRLDTGCTESRVVRSRWRRRIGEYVVMSYASGCLPVLRFLLEWIADGNERLAAFRPGRPSEILHVVECMAIRDRNEVVLAGLREAGWRMSGKNRKRVHERVK